MSPARPASRSLACTVRAALLGTLLAGCTDEPQPTGPSASAALDGPMAPVATTTANATATDLGGIPGFSGAVALAINASGQAVGYVANNAADALAVSFGPPTVLYNVSTERATIALALNDAGVVSGAGVGGALGLGGNVFAGSLPDGWLPPLPGTLRYFGEFGARINNAGEVVASAWFGGPLHGVVWIPGPTGYTPTDLGTFNGLSTEVLGLAPSLSGANRIIVGRYPATTFNGSTPLVFRNGAWSELPPIVPGGCGGRNDGQANDASDAGVIVGVTCTSVGPAVASVWENGSVRSLEPECAALPGPFPGGGSAANAIAYTSTVPSRTLIVGVCQSMPAVWFDDGMGGYGAELLPLLSGDTEGVAFDVNTAGQIVGYTRNSVFSTDPTAHAVLWTYTPPPLTPNQAPTASTGGHYGGNEGVSVAFDGTGSSDPDGNTLAFDWDFGDGSEHSSGATPSHTYVDNGTYTITLGVDDGHGGIDVATTTATISNVAPQVNAGAASSIQSGQTLSFSGNVIDAGAADTPSSWTLDWGDATTPLSGNTTVPGLVSATHTYFGTGTFTLQLTVTDKDGGVGMATRTVTVDPRFVAVGAAPDAVSLTERRAKEIDIIILSAPGLDATQIDPTTLSAGDGNDPDALPLQRKNGAHVLSMRDVNRDGLRDLTFSVEKLDANLGLAAPGTTLVVRGAIPTSFGAIVLRGSVTIAVSP